MPTNATSDPHVSGSKTDTWVCVTLPTATPPLTHTDGLHEKLEDIAWIDEQPWRESLVVTGAETTVVEDVDDDLERELAFYNQVGVGVGGSPWGGVSGWRGGCLGIRQRLGIRQSLGVRQKLCLLRGGQGPPLPVWRRIVCVLCVHWQASQEGFTGIWQGW